MKTGWQSLFFEDCIEKVAYSAKIQRKDFLGSGKYPVISQEEGLINGYWNNEADLFPVKKSLVVFGDHTKVMKYVDFDFVLGADGVKILQPRAFLNSRFFYYQLQGTTLDTLGYARHYKLLRELKLNFPSMPEQQRIVTILDEAFAGIATAIANAEKNLANAREVYISVMNSVFTSSLEGQKEVKLGDLITTLTDYHANGSYEVLKENVELKETEDYAWMVRSTDFEKDFQNEMRYISKSAYEFLSKSQILGGEIIMSKIGNAGKVYLMPEILRPCSLAMNLFLIRIDENKTSNKFIYHYLKSKGGERQILSKLKGAATQTITKDSVRDITIPLFSKDMQEHIVNKLELIRVQTQALESIYQQKLIALDELKKSILNQAFSGQLQ